MSINKVIILGHIARMNDLNVISDTASVLNFSVATNERWKKDGEWVDRATFHNVVAWNKTAETISQYFNVGNQIAIEGKLQVRSYFKDEEEQDRRYVTEIVVERFSFVDKKENNGTASPSKEYDEDQKPEKELNDLTDTPDEDELPF